MSFKAEPATKTLQALRQYQEPSELQQMAACEVLDNSHAHTDYTDAKVKKSGETRRSQG